jgi:hypothetical protein
MRMSDVMPLLSSLRANLVLFAFAVAASDGAWLVASALIGRPQWIGLLAVRAATIGTATAITLLLRRAAKRAFDTADRADQLVPARGRAALPTVSDRCNDDWLVQLHIDLHPRLFR